VALAQHDEMLSHYHIHCRYFTFR